MILPSLKCLHFAMEMYMFFANTKKVSSNLKCSCWKASKYSVISLKQREVEIRCPLRIWSSVNLSYPIIVSLLFWITWTVLMPAITYANYQFLILLLFKRFLAKSICIFMVRYCFHLSDIRVHMHFDKFLTNESN